MKKSGSDSYSKEGTKMGKYIRICSGCEKKLEYKYPSDLLRAEKKGHNVDPVDK